MDGMFALLHLWAYLRGEGRKATQLDSNKGKNEIGVAFYAELLTN